MTSNTVTNEECAMWMLTAENPRVGGELPGTTDGADWAVYDDPRRIYIEPPLEDLVETSLPEMVTGRDVHLVQVAPLGTAEQDADGSRWCRAGWRVVSVEPNLARMFGPRGADLVRLVHRLDADEDLVEELAEVEEELDLDDAEELAVDALVEAGADGRWLQSAVPCTWPRSVLAVASADLIDQGTYALLTEPWQRKKGMRSR